MLVLTRRIGEEIVINGDVRIAVLETRGKQVRLGLIASQTTRILRSEILTRKHKLSNPSQTSPGANSSISNVSSIMSGVMAVAR